MVAAPSTVAGPRLRTDATAFGPRKESRATGALSAKESPRCARGSFGNGNTWYCALKRNPGIGLAWYTVPPMTMAFTVSVECTGCGGWLPTELKLMS